MSFRIFLTSSFPESPKAIAEPCKSNPESATHTFTTTCYEGLTRTYTPTSTSNPSARRAVALSTVKIDLAYGKEAIVNITVVDFLTGDILLEAIVSPAEDGEVVDWKTDISMIDPEMIEEMRKDGWILEGVKEAREAFLKIVGSETILVGFNLRGDLEALRVAHENVADYKVLYTSYLIPTIR